MALKHLLFTEKLLTSLANNDGFYPAKLNRYSISRNPWPAGERYLNLLGDEKGIGRTKRRIGLLSEIFPVTVKHYDLYFDIDFKNLKFNGIATIELKSDEKLLNLNCSNPVGKIEANGAPVKFSQAKDLLTVECGPFDGLLRVFYSGSITDELVGLYRAAYDNTYVLSTQLEASNARRMFPCIDHPNYKAEFTLRIKIDRELDAISNMPVQSVENEDGERKKKIVTFKKTPRMSTYLLYLGVGHFEELREKIGSLELIAATTPGKAETGRFALGVAKKSISYYEPYFGIPFPLPKIHLVAVPEFAMGAMENWGAVSFRETAFAVSAGSSIRTRKRVATVVAHELGHMWFGNLVTFKWWNDLWLNESFATFMEYKVVDSAFPNWRIWEDFLRNESSAAMRKDCLRCTHPIEVDVKSPDEIEQIFDDISYSKGASIIRMIEDYMGPEDFRKGLSAYLRRYSYSNAAGDDLWDELGVSGKPVKKVVNEWIKKPGYPALEVIVKGDKVVLRQRRFLLTGTPEKNEGKGQQGKELWPIPVSIKMDGTSRRLLIDKEEMSIAAKGIVSLIVNVDRVGFYKVFYNGCHDLFWKADSSQLDKWGFISDAFSFLFEGSLSVNAYLEILERYQDTTELLLAQEISDQLSLLCLIIPSMVKEISMKFHRSQLKILEKSRDENSIMFRATAARRLSMLDDEYAKELGSKFLKFEEVEPNLKESVAVAFARAYGDFDSILKRFRASSSDEERVWLINAMVSFKDPSLVSRSFELASNGEIKRQDVRTMLAASASNGQARDVVWAWMKANMEKLREIYKSTGILALVFPAIIPIIGTGKKEVAQYFREHPIPEAERGILVGLELLGVYDRFVNVLPERSSTH